MRFAALVLCNAFVLGIIARLHVTYVQRHSPRIGTQVLMLDLVLPVVFDHVALSHDPDREGRREGIDQTFQQNGAAVVCSQSRLSHSNRRSDCIQQTQADVFNGDVEACDRSDYGLQVICSLVSWDAAGGTPLFA